MDVDREHEVPVLAITYWHQAWGNEGVGDVRRHHDCRGDQKTIDLLAYLVRSRKTKKKLRRQLVNNYSGSFGDVTACSMQAHYSVHRSRPTEKRKTCLD